MESRKNNKKYRLKKMAIYILATLTFFTASLQKINSKSFVDVAVDSIYVGMIEKAREDANRYFMFYIDSRNCPDGSVDKEILGRKSIYMLKNLEEFYSQLIDEEYIKGRKMDIKKLLGDIYNKYYINTLSKEAKQK